MMVNGVKLAPNVDHTSHEDKMFSDILHASQSDEDLTGTPKHLKDYNKTFSKRCTNQLGQ